MAKNAHENDAIDDSVDLERVLELLGKGNNTWNHRIIKTTSEDGVYYAIHEVHYSDGVPHSCTVDPIAVGGEDIDSIKWTLQKMLLAADKEVIPMEYFDNLSEESDVKEKLQDIHAKAENTFSKDEKMFLDQLDMLEESDPEDRPDLGGC